MKLPPNFKLLFTTNPLKIYFQYTYENGEIYESEIMKHSNLLSCLIQLDQYNINIKQIKNLKLPENFSIKYKFDQSNPYELYFKYKYVSKYRSIENEQLIKDDCEKYFIKLNINPSNIINKLNKNEDIDTDILYNISVYS